jgi:ubiquinone/menaquinone biosynthesis C-methylase UbiE
MQAALPVDKDHHILKPNSTPPDCLFLGESLQLFYAFTEPLILRWLRPGDRMLDVGCGDGKLAVTLLWKASLGRVTGIDIREDAIEAARLSIRDEGAKFICGNAEDIDWVRTLGPFDVILTRTALHHFYDPIAALVEFSKMLPENGRLILIDIDRESACWDVFGFPLTLLITWTFVVRTLGLLAATEAIKGMKYPGKAWRSHRAADVAHRQAIGWFCYRDIRNKLESAFPAAMIGRMASVCGFGGVHYMVYEKHAHK